MRAKILAACLVLTLTPPAALAQEQPSAADIVKALAPGEGAQAPRTRSLRGVDVQQPTKPASIDLYINFKYDSAELEPDSLAVMRSLGAALKSDALARTRIAIVGHTDAKGGDDYNQALSERRAAAVRNLLVGLFDIGAERLVASGRGETALKDPSSPDDGVNRRVEIRNVGQSN